MIPFLLALGCTIRGDDSGPLEADADTDADTDTDPDADPASPLANCESLEHEDWAAPDDDDEFLRRYDANGNLTYFRADLSVDHAWDAITTYEYDEADNRVVEADDVDGDGDVDAEAHSTYDEENRLITVTRYEGATLVEVWIYLYGSDGIESVEIDAAGDGTVDDVHHVSTEVDGSGVRTTTQELDEGNDGTVDAVFRTVEDQRLYEIWYDSDADGDPDAAAESVYDDYDNIRTSWMEFYDEDTGKVWYRDDVVMDLLDELHRPVAYNEEETFFGDTAHMTGTYVYTCP